ncbi:MAG: Integral membrane protein TerC, partial [uncultured Arthrobacter sp.]
DCSLLGLAGSDRRDPRHACHRPVRPPPRPRDRRPRGRPLVRRLGCLRCRLRSAHLAGVRRRVRAAVLRRIPHREIPGRRQRLRLGHHLQLLRRPPRIPASGPVPRGAGRSRLPRHLHRRRLRHHRIRRLGALPVRGVPALHGLPDDPPAQRAHGAGEVTRPQAVPPPCPDDRCLPRPAPARPEERRPPCHAAAGGARPRRGHGHHLRGRLHPGDLRRHRRGVPCLHRQRLRHPRPAGHVLPARRPDAPLHLPQGGPRAGADLGGYQDAPEDRHLLHPHPDFARRRRDHPGRVHRRQPARHPRAGPEAVACPGEPSVPGRRSGRDGRTGPAVAPSGTRRKGIRARPWFDPL